MSYFWLSRSAGRVQKSPNHKDHYERTLLRTHGCGDAVAQVVRAAFQIADFEQTLCSYSAFQSALQRSLLSGCIDPGCVNITSGSRSWAQIIGFNSSHQLLGHLHHHLGHVSVEFQTATRKFGPIIDGDDGWDKLSESWSFASCANHFPLLDLSCPRCLGVYVLVSTRRRWWRVSV